MVAYSPSASQDSYFCYVNSTSRVQMIRLFDGLNVMFEKLVFPGDKVLLETTEENELEVVRCESGSLEIERISCLC